MQEAGLLNREGRLCRATLVHKQTDQWENTKPQKYFQLLYDSSGISQEEGREGWSAGGAEISGEPHGEMKLDETLTP